MLSLYVPEVERVAAAPSSMAHRVLIGAASMKKYLTVVALLIVALTAGSAHAVSITITDTNSYAGAAPWGPNSPGVFFAGPSGSTLNGFPGVQTFSDSFNLVPFGYQPGSSTLTSAFAIFNFSDDNNSGKLGTDPAQESVKVTFNPTQPFPGAGFTTWNGGAITISGQVVGNAFLTLESTGMLSYRIDRNPSSGGDFFLTSASLTANANVPDGGATLSLFGIAMMGVAAARRRFSIAK